MFLKRPAKNVNWGFEKKIVENYFLLKNFTNSLIYWRNHAIGTYFWIYISFFYDINKFELSITFAARKENSLNGDYKKEQEK